ncbi:MAG: transcription termination factor NusA [Dehalococcoidia bacterium]
MKSEFLIAITQLSAEKNLPKEVVLQAVEAALASAYKKDTQEAGNISVRIDRQTGAVHVYSGRTVVESVEDPRLEMDVAAARRYKPDAQVGDVVNLEITPQDAGRIAAQTAKQVVLQRLRDAEREMVFEEFAGREGDTVSGVVQRVEPKQVVIDLGKAEAILPVTEQVRGEHYRPGQRLKLYLLEVQRTSKGPQVVVSRTHRNLLRRLFELEVPEIHRGVVEIKAIAREPGQRSKVAVAARQEGVDPVGSCVGLRGLRIQNIVNELGGERIDVVQWDPNPARFVANAISPAQTLAVSTNEEENTALVVVPDRQLSLAIGKEGQNARLAAKLTSWRIDIKSQAAVQQEAVQEAPAVAAVVPAATPDRTPAPVEGEVEVETTATSEAAEPVAAEPAPGLQPLIRFAEDVTGRVVAASPKSKRGKERKGGREEVVELTAKPKKAKKPRRATLEEELEEELEYEA